MIIPPRVLVAFALFAVAVLRPLPAQDGSDAINIGLLDQRPKPKEQIKPVYPRALAKANLIGQVTIEMIIGLEGKVEEANVTSSNNPWFERPALDAIMQWRFTPGLKDGKPVRVRAMQLVEFSLPGKEGEEYFEIKKSLNHNQLAPELQWDQAPKVLATAYPVYPFVELVAGTSGKATVNCIIGPQGRIEQAEVTEATAPEFGQAVLAMLDVWRFQAATKAGEPCKAWLSLSYEFSPKSEDVPVTDSALDILKELQQVSPRIYGGSALDRPLQAIFQKPPVYPLALQGRGGQAGEAMVEFFIDPKGDVQLPRIVSSTVPEFGYAAVQAVTTWRFKPPLKGGKPVIVKVRVPVKFPALAKAPADEAAATPSATRLYELAELGNKGTQPKPLAMVNPTYPSAMMRDKVTGSVTVAYTINTRGKTSEVKVVSSTRPEFEKAAMDAIKASTFIPAQKDGQPVSVRVSQKIDFDLNNP